MRKTQPHINDLIYCVKRSSERGLRYCVILGTYGIVIANSCFTKHLPHDKRKRIDVNSSVSFDRFVPFNFEVEDLRAHVSFRAHSAVLLLVQTTVRFRVSNGQSEIGDDAAPIFSNENVFRLNVAVGDCRLALGSKKVQAFRSVAVRKGNGNYTASLYVDVCNSF